MSYWDRPKPARDWHWFLGRIGSTLIAAGLLVFLFVGYQLWGTGIEAAQSQQRLGDSFEDLATTSSGVIGSGGAGSSGVDNAAQAPDPVTVANGDPLAVIEIPAIGVSKYVVAGVDTADLKKGPGHYPNTPLPGELGNAAIAGHRTTYGEPFRQLDELEIGDEITVTDLVGRTFTYLVTGQRIVTPQDSWVVDTVDPTVATLTLTTCHPEFSARQRLIVFAQLDTSRTNVAEFSASAYATAENSNLVPNENESELGIDSGQIVTAESESAGDVFDKGWFSDPSAIPHVIAWSLLAIVIVLLSWQIAKRLRNRAIGFAVGFVPFFVVLYFVFQNVNRLLPPNL